jgi:putative transposase
LRFAFIQEEKATYPVTTLCRTLAVSRCGFYAWQGRPESKRHSEDRRLTVLIRASHEESRRTYGSPRVHIDLPDWSERVGR